MAAQLPPGVNPYQVPASPPPPGLTSYLVDPPTLESATLAVGILMIILTSLTVTARLYTTIRITRTSGLEDWSCLAATILLYIYIGLVFYLNRYARHIWDVPIAWLNADYFKGRFARDMFFGPATFFAKSSILLLYLRLFSPTKWFRYTVYSTLVFMFGLYWCYVAVNAGLCAPRPGQSWLFPGVFQRCQKQEAYAIIQGVFNVALDIEILALPIPVVTKLTLQTGRKLAILATFGTGSIALVCSIISLVYRIKLNHATDTFWLGACTFIAIICEVAITIICSCAPALFSLGRHLFADHSFFASIKNTILRTHNSSHQGTVQGNQDKIAAYKAQAGSDKPWNYSSSSSTHPPGSVSHKADGYLELGEVPPQTMTTTPAVASGPPPPPLQAPLQTAKGLPTPPRPATTRDTDEYLAAERSRIKNTTNIDILR